jgi:hypothetical protein
MGSRMRRRICSRNAARRVLKKKSKSSCVTQRRVKRDDDARLKRTTRGVRACNCTPSVVRLRPFDCARVRRRKDVDAD